MLGAPKVRPGGGSGGAAKAPPQREENFEILWSKGLFLDSFFRFSTQCFFAYFKKLQGPFWTCDWYNGWCQGFTYVGFFSRMDRIFFFIFFLFLQLFAIFYFRWCLLAYFGGCRGATAPPQIFFELVSSTESSFGPFFLIFSFFLTPSFHHFSFISPTTIFLRPSSFKTVYENFCLVLLKNTNKILSLFFEMVLEQ